MRHVAIIALGILLCCGPAMGGGAESHRLGAAEFAEGTLEGLSLDHNGWLQPGLTSTPTPLDVPTTWAVAHKDGVTWIGSGNKALVLRVDAKGTIQRIETGGERDGVLVTALAALPDGGVAAAVAPGGRVLKISKTGEVKPLAILPVEYVWALAANDKGHLIAACGSPGVVYDIDPFGAVEKRADIFDEHARCLAVDGKRLLVGTAPKGLVVEITKKKGARVLRDLEPQEVVGITATSTGIIVAANEDTVGGNAERIAGVLGQIAKPPETEANEKPAARTALQNGRVLLLTTDGATETIWSQDKTAVVSLCHKPNGGLAGEEGAYIGTQPDGRVIKVTTDFEGLPSSGRGLRHLRTASMLDVPEGEVSALTLDADGHPLAVTSNPGVLHRTQPPTKSKPGRWTSAVLDPGARARWGDIRIWGDHLHSLEFRHGETEEPDETWAPWTATRVRRGAAGVTARYLQLRISLQSCRAIEIVRRTPNRAPQITKFERAERKPEADTGLVKASPIQSFSWKVEDPDGDPIRTILTVRRDGPVRETTLIDGKILPKPAYEWDTTGWPDGLYHLRLVVTDDAGNPRERARISAESMVDLRVDNTPPRVQISAFAWNRGVLTLNAKADDGDTGQLRWARMSLNGGPWIHLTAQDGLFDRSQESFAFSDLVERKHYDVVLQVSDAEGNLGTAASFFRLPE